MVRVLSCVIAGFLLLACSCWASALSLRSQAPGNIFAAGSPVVVSVTGAQGEVSYELSDYFGHKLSSGTATSSIQLPALEPGWYQLQCKDGASEVTAGIGVVLDRAGAPLPVDGRVCSDVAASWLVDPSKYRSIAKIMRTAGLAWARERLSWTGTEKKRGEYDWNKYQKVADAYEAEGVHLYQTWHDSPLWTHSGIKGYIRPYDLRDVYHYARAAASHFARQVKAWEIWNEPDIGFWPELSDRFSGYSKAAYLGLKDGNPRAIVLQGSFCHGVTDFARGIYECGTHEYSEVLNWHTYRDTSTYPITLGAHLDLLGRYCRDGRPVWLTESGIRLDGSEGPDKRILSADGQRAQCRFMARSVVMSLVAGTDKHFFFVLPSYGEGKVEFGALRNDLTPYPSFVALSAAANILGVSTYRGQFETGREGVVAHAFATPAGNVLVAWSEAETETEIAVPTDRQTLRIADIFGAQSPAKSEGGAVKVNVGPEAVYLLDIGGPIEKQLTGEPRPRGKQPRLNPSRIVVAGHADLKMVKDQDVHILPSRGAFDYTVEVYNFSDKGGVSGIVEVTAPKGWRVSSAKRLVSLPAMGREALKFRVEPDRLSESRFTLAARARFGGEKVSPCVSSFRYDLPAIQPLDRKPLDWAIDADRWTPEASPNCTLAFANSAPGVLRFDTKFSDENERWAYPVLRLAEPVDMSGFDGIAFDLHVPEDSYASAIRVVLVQPGGVAYAGSARSIGAKHRVVALFSDMKPLGKGAPGPDQPLDLSKISEVKFGCDAGRGYLVFEVSGFELVEFPSVRG